MNQIRKRSRNILKLVRRIPLPQEKPIHNSLSKPVEPVFLTLLDKTVQGSFKYGVSKYGTELHSFNGRSELQDLAEELVSALRYATQLDMRCQVTEELLREYQASHTLMAPGCKCLCKLCKKTDLALGIS